MYKGWLCIVRLNHLLGLQAFAFFGAIHYNKVFFYG